MATIAAEPGRRWALLTVLLAVLVTLNYADRGALAIAAPGLKDELHLTAFGFGIAVSAFSWIYAPAQFAVGWLSDRLCVYRLIAAGLALWAASTMLTAATTSLAMLVMLRLMLGLGEGVAFPAASRIIAHHVPDARRGIANAAVGSALALGPAIGTFVGGLILVTHGWRAIFLIYGAVTLLWLIPWHFAAKPHWQRPSEVRAQSVPMRDLIRRPAVLVMGIGHFFNTYAFFFLLAWLPLYLVKDRGFSILTMTSLTTTMFIVQALGALFFGWLSDRLVAAGQEEGQLRKGLMSFSMAVSAVTVFGLSQAHTPAVVGLWLVIGGFGAGPAGTNCYAIAQMFAGKRASGSWVGAMNGMGNTSGIIGPLMTGAIIDRTGNYLAAFYLAAALSAIGAFWWWLAIPRVAPVPEYR